MAPHTETTFGASIVPSAQNSLDVARPPPSLASPALTPAVSQDSLAASYVDHKPVPPHSPFYQHPPASHERADALPKSRLGGPTHLDVSKIEKGWESSDVTPMSNNDDNPFCSKISVDANQECTMWPSRRTLVDNKMAEKKKQRANRFCACAGPRHHWETATKKQRLMIQLLVALIIVGAMIGLGVGISKAVHGSYYVSSGSSTST